MIQNPLFLSLSACKQRTSDYVSTLIQNPYKTHTKRYRTYFVSILYLFCIIPNTKPKYIYINNLSGYVSLFRLHRPYIHILLSHWLCLLLNNRQIKNIKRAFQYLKSTVSHYDYYVNFLYGVEVKKINYSKTVKIYQNSTINQLKTAQVLVQIVLLLTVLWKSTAYMKI